MGKFTPEQLAELRRRRKESSLYETLPRIPGVGTALRTLDRSARVIGDVAGTAAAALPPVALGRTAYETVLPDKDPLPFMPPDIGNVNEALGAFWGQAKEGEFDAGLDAFSEAMDAGWGYYGAMDILGGAALTGGPALAGTKLIAKAPGLASTIARHTIPATRGGVQARRGIQTGIEAAGKGLRVPWEAEEAIGRGIFTPIGAGFRAGSRLLGRGGPEVAEAGVETVTKTADAPQLYDTQTGELLPTTPTTAAAPPVTPAAGAGEAAEGAVEATAKGARKGGTVYHAGREVVRPEDMQKGVIFHTGTEKSALDRIKIPSTEGKTAVINTYTVRPKKPFLPGGKLLDERVGEDRTYLSSLQNMPNLGATGRNPAWISRNEIIEQGYDVIPYINVIEDPGSVSYMVLNPDALTVSVLPRTGRTGYGGAGFIEPPPTAPTTAAPVTPGVRAAREASEEAAEEVPQRLEASGIDSSDAPPPQRPTTEEARQGPDEAINLFERARRKIVLTAMSDEVATLSKWNRTMNWLGHFSESVIPRTKEVEGVIALARKLQNKLKNVTESYATTQRTFIRSGLNKHFTVNSKTGHLLDEKLQNKVTFKQGKNQVTIESPTLQDIAARYDAYEPHLTPDQKIFIDNVRDMLESGSSFMAGKIKYIIPGFNQILRKSAPNWGKRQRPDITGNGFYISRGRVKDASGKEYSIADELEDIFKMGSEETRTGILTAEQKALRPAMGKLKVTNAKGQAVAVDKVSYDLVDKSVEDYIKAVTNKITDADVDTAIRGIAKARKGMGRTKRITVGRGKGIIKGDVADDALANAINRTFNESFAQKFMNAQGIKNVNNYYRSLKANFDLSAIGIHGSLAMFKNPALWSEATELIFKSINASRATQTGQQVIDDAIRIIDEGAVEAGRLDSKSWSMFGLRHGGTATETAFPGLGRYLDSDNKIATTIQAGFDLSNRLFGSFGDVLRLKWADELLQSEISKGKTLNDIITAGDMEKIARDANRLTGWSDTKFAGDVGEFAMFASRFFQSRLEVLGQSLRGVSQLRPPTAESLRTLGQTKFNVPFQIQSGARRGIPIGSGRKITGSGKSLIESDVLTSLGRNLTIEQREALKTMVRLIGLGAAATESANALMGHKTDRRPIVDGRVNPNFYTIRFGDRDFSIFGPTIGLFRAMATLAIGAATAVPDLASRDFSGAAKKSTQAFLDASRGLGSGVVTIAWDNLTGYTGFEGKPAPFGLLRDDPDLGIGPNTVAELNNTLRYILDLSTPISPSAVVSEIGAGIQSASQGDLLATAGAVVGIGAEAIGGRVARLSRTDHANETAQDLYGKSYEELDANIKAEVDTLVSDKIGERGYTGSKGYLYKEKDAIRAKFLEDIKDIAGEYLTEDITSIGWSAIGAREELNQLRDEQRAELYGTKWDPNKKRTVGGIYENLYDRDEVREEPEVGTREHRVWQYYKIYDDAMGEDGEIDWDEATRLETKFWGSLTPDQREEIFRNIRTQEESYPPQIRDLLNAGRYAQDIKLNIAGHLSTYWELREHPALISYIALEADTSETEVILYLDMTSAQREAQRHVPGKARDIQAALTKAGRNKGVLANLQKTFISSAPSEWILAMMAAGYRYRGSENINNNIREQMRQGREMPSDLNYQKLYQQQVVGQ